MQRAWRLAVNEQTGEIELARRADEGVERQLHMTIARVGRDIERLSFNTAIAAMIEFVNAATAAGRLTRSQLDRFTLALSPLAPHLAEEIWSKLGHSESLAYEPWPEHDESLITQDRIELPVQIGGKLRGKVTVDANADAKQIE